MVEVLFVHGALVRDGAWWWKATADLLEERTGVRSRSVELPSCGEGATPAPGAGLVDDATALREALDALGDGAIVVGHSYGGTVVAEGADHPAARHLVYISSYLPDVGQAQGDIMSGESDPVSIGMNETAGTLHVEGYDADSFAARFLNDVPSTDVQDAAWSRVTSQTLAAFSTPTTRAAWQGRPSTYLICADDRSTSIGLQRFHAARATRAVELPTGHHPFLSRPDLVVAELEAIIEKLPRAD